MEPTDKIIFICPACAFRARIPGQYIGQTIRCPGCNTPQKVTPPAPDYEASGRTVAISRVAVSDKPAKPAPAPVAPISEAIRVPGKGPAPAAPSSTTDSASIEGKLLFVCASCKLRARVPARFGGQTIRCPKCQTPGVVPRTNANPAIEQSTGSTVMITRAQLEAPPPKPSGSGRWRDPSKPRAPTPLSTPTPPAPPPEPAAEAADADSDLLGPPLETPGESAAETPGELASDTPTEPEAPPEPAAEAEEDPLADLPPDTRPRPGVVHRRGNSSAAIDVPKPGKTPAKPGKPLPGKPGTGKVPPGKPGKPVKPAADESDAADDAPPAAAKQKKSPLILILGVLLVLAIAAAAWGWSTAFAAQDEVAAEKARSAKTLKALSEAQFAFTEADNRAKALAAKLAASATTAGTADPTATGDSASDSATKGATAPDGKQP